jgi:hypothetical protein
MVDYRPQFKPTYNFSKQTLVERISNTFYNSFRDKSCREITSDYITTTHNDIRFVYDNVKKNKAYAGALIVSVGLSALANFLEAKDADIQGYSVKAIEFRSLVAEITTHTLVSAGAFTAISRSEGKSWKRIYTDLKDILYASAVIALVIYPPIRNTLADFLMEEGMEPHKATFWSQISLTPAYYAAVIYSKNTMLPKVKSYLKNKKENKEAKHLMKKADEVEKANTKFNTYNDRVNNSKGKYQESLEKVVKINEKAS